MGTHDAIIRTAAHVVAITVKTYLCVYDWNFGN